MKYKCLGCEPLGIPCDYTFEWKNIADYTPEDYERLPQKHKDHLIANKHSGFLKINDERWKLIKYATEEKN